MSDPIMPLYVDGETVLVSNSSGIQVYADEYGSINDLYADIVDGKVVVQAMQERNYQLDHLIHTMLQGGMRPIPIIKAVRYLSGAGLKEAKDYVQSHCSYGIYNS